MRGILMVSVILTCCAANASAAEDATRTWPLTTFGTTHTVDVFTQCVLDAATPEFPASTITKGQIGRQITIAKSEGIAAVIEISEPSTNGKSIVLVRSPHARQPLGDPLIKMARNCS